MRIPAFVLVLAALGAPALAQDAPPPALTADAINSADLATIPVAFVAPDPNAPPPATPPAPSPAVVRLQVLLDRAGASPGVIDGFDGSNVRKAIAAFEAMQGLPSDGQLDPEVIGRLQSTAPVVGGYTIDPKDAEDIGPPIPEDYAAQAQMKALAYTSVAEELAERFHMDEDFLKALNPGATFAPGEAIAVADPGQPMAGEAVRVEADKTLRQVRAYDATGRILAAYPATIGSTDTPSPSGTHTVETIVDMPGYTYNPKVNFQQGSNTEVLTLPPGPNGPVGSTWIGLSQPTYGIHGTPEPSLIDKASSHGCVRLTNWDAAELAGMLTKGATVDFTGTSG